MAVGTVMREAVRFDEAEVQIDDAWVPLHEQTLEATYRHVPLGQPEPPEDAEYVVAVEWIANQPAAQAYWEKGMFANQNSACKLRQEFTLDRLAEHFHLEGEDRA